MFSYMTAKLKKVLGDMQLDADGGILHKRTERVSSCKVWFDELAKRGVGQEDNVLTQEVWNKPGQIGHYTQMVWQDTYRLGCYVHRCPSMTYVVCQYGPRGNWIGDPIYEMGNPCKTDDDCMCSNCKCSRKEALCIVH
ncbi:hypothetical protein Y032_0114g465 [Ancylostoma ceylanicum]|nr:hypothetical protein Y032_0114g465 [Ancylostoma ceylanicum]